MKQDWSRRDFLRTSLEGSLVVGAAFGWARSAWPAPRTALPARDTLRLAMDELIPHQPGHPAASDVGGVAYLETRAASEESFAAQLSRLLTALDESARSTLARPFAQLTGAERLDLLRDLERSAADLFAGFRDAVYEAYYTQPGVWRRIGYRFHAGLAARPSVERFDQAVLDSARRLPKRYREVP